MGQSGSAPMVLNRGTDEEIEVEGFKHSTRRKLWTALAVILTGGLLLMFLLWKKRLAVILTHKSCTLTSSDVVFIKETKRNHSTLTKMSKMTAPTSGASVPFFMYKKVRFVWDDSTFTFTAQQPFHAGHSTGTLAAKSHGLTSDDVEKQRAFYGSNKFTIDARPIWEIIADEAANPFYLFQLYAAAVWYLQEDFAFATAILATSVVSIGVTVWETRRQTMALRQRVHFDEEVVVVRDGRESTVASSKLVPGDVIVVPNGRSVPVTCDAVLLSGDALVNEALLTGESVPVTKISLTSNVCEMFDPEVHKQNILFSGTEIVQIRGGNGEGGNPKALVIRTGFMTLKGELIRSVLYPEGLDVGFFREYLRLLPLFLLLGVGATVYTAYVWCRHGAPTWKIVVYCLDVLTFVVPPVLPIILTSIRASAQRRLKKIDIFCLSTSHIPIAGAVDVFCFDKTGTLTENLLGFAGALPIKDKKCDPLIGDLSGLPSDDAFTVGVATCHSISVINGELVGNATDLCVFGSLDWELDQGCKMQFLEGSVPVVSVVRPKDGAEGQEDVAVVRTFPFDPTQQCTTVVVKRNYLNCCEVFVKGAADKVLSSCEPGSIPEELPGYLAWYEHQGYRALALARKELPPAVSVGEAASLTRENLASDYSLCGILLLENVLKEQTSDVLASLRLGGIDNVMVTGDSLLTALSVARKCNLVDPDVKILVVWAELVGSTLQAVQHLKVEYLDPEATPDSEEVDKDGTVKTPKDYVFALEGRCFDLLSQHEPDLFLRVVQRGRVFARMLPKQKEKLVRTLRALGRVVGMCGDGCNDLGALRAANVGLSLASPNPASSAAAQASIAAPFTVGSTSVDVDDIVAVDSLIREGRSTLSSYVGATSYAISLCFTALLFVVIDFTVGKEPSEGQYIYMDVVLAVVPSLVFGCVQPAAEMLTSLRPPKSLMHPVPLASIFSFLGWQALFFVTAWRHYRRQPWYIPTEGFTLTSEGSIESTTLFYSTCWSFISASFVFSHGIPFREPMVFNKIYSLWTLLSVIVTGYITVAPHDPVAEWLHLVKCPHVEFNIILLLLGLINICISFLWEVYVVQDLLGNRLVPHLANNWMLRPFEKLEYDLRSKPDWPPVGLIPPVDDNATPTSVSSSYRPPWARLESCVTDPDDTITGDGGLIKPAPSFAEKTPGIYFPGGMAMMNRRSGQMGPGGGDGHYEVAPKGPQLKPDTLDIYANTDRWNRRGSPTALQDDTDDASPDYAEIKSPDEDNQLPMMERSPFIYDAWSPDQGLNYQRSFRTFKGSRKGRPDNGGQPKAESNQQESMRKERNAPSTGDGEEVEMVPLYPQPAETPDWLPPPPTPTTLAAAAGIQDIRPDSSSSGTPLPDPPKFESSDEEDALTIQAAINRSSSLAQEMNRKSATIRQRPSFIFTHDDIRGALSPPVPRSPAAGTETAIYEVVNPPHQGSRGRSSNSASDNETPIKSAPPKPQRRSQSSLATATDDSLLLGVKGAADKRASWRSSRSSAVSQAASDQSDIINAELLPLMSTTRQLLTIDSIDDSDNESGRRSVVKGDEFYS